MCVTNTSGLNHVKIYNMACDSILFLLYLRDLSLSIVLTQYQVELLLETIMLNFTTNNTKLFAVRSSKKRKRNLKRNPYEFLQKSNFIRTEAVYFAKQFDT